MRLPIIKHVLVVLEASYEGLGSGGDSPMVKYVRDFFVKSEELQIIKELYSNLYVP